MTDPPVAEASPPEPPATAAAHGAARKAAAVSAGLIVAAVIGGVACASAQTVTNRGFVEVRGVLFPQDASNDSRNAVADLVARDELFLEATSWLQFAAGVEARANTHDQVDTSWRLDAGDRGIRRPALSLRRLSATIARGPLTLDIGKQFIRWGKADIVTPTDRFAPRDFVNVIDTELLPVSGARAALQLGSHTIEGAWVPRLTPSRMPLPGQRWTPAPEGAEAALVLDGRSTTPHGGQGGVRWNYTGAGYEGAFVFYEGFNHLPSFAVTPESAADALPPEHGLPRFVVRRFYPDLRLFGGDGAVNTGWVTLKGEAAYFSSSTPTTDNYVLYVIQAERQSGEWVFVGGYAGEIVTTRRGALTFAPDRGTARSFVGRAAYTLDTNRSVAVEGALRQNGRGLYARAEYSQAVGRHWRSTVIGGLIRGEPDDFLGQYRRNSHMTVALRYSF